MQPLLFSMKTIFTPLCLLLLVFNTTAQTDTIAPPKKEFANGFGLSMGVVYGILRANTTAQFIPNSDRVIKTSVENKIGISGAVFYEYKVPRWSFRPAVEANVIFSNMRYDLEKFNDEEGYIFPVAVDLPLDIMYHPRKKNAPSLMVGARPIFAFDQFNSFHPSTKTFAFNVDAGISYLLPAGNNEMRIELMYSFGLIDVLNKKEGDIYSMGIDHIYRDVLGLKLYFN